MLNHLATTLDRAKSYTALVNARCKAARNELLEAQDRLHDAHGALRDVRKISRTMQPDVRGGTPVKVRPAVLSGPADPYCLYDLLTAMQDETQARTAARDAYDICVALEKQLKQAQAAEAEARLDHDFAWVNQGKLEFVKQEKRDRFGPLVEWKKQVNIAFAENYTAVGVAHDFPEPLPLAADARHALSCKDKNKTRPIAACECAVRAAFLGDNLRTERLRWHPSNFECCPLQVKAACQSKAKYIFGIVEAMYQAARKP